MTVLGTINVCELSSVSDCQNVNFIFLSLSLLSHFSSSFSNGSGSLCFPSLSLSLPYCCFTILLLRQFIFFHFQKQTTKILVIFCSRFLSFILLRFLRFFIISLFDFLFFFCIFFSFIINFA